MDYSRLIKVLMIGLLAFAVSGCAKSPQAAKDASNTPPSVLETTLSSERALLLSDHFLEFQKGYTVRVRDVDRGLLVTDWATEGRGERYQVTLRVTDQVNGAMISAHIRVESLDAGKWKDLPTLGDLESQFLNDLNSYLSAYAKPQSPKN